MGYKVVDIYKDLPQKAGCADCGKPGCFAFATGVYLEGHAVAECPLLTDEQRTAMETKLGRSGTETVKAEAVEQAAEFLFEKLAEGDLEQMAARASTPFDASTGRAQVPLLGSSYTVQLGAVKPASSSDDEEEPNIWVKVLTLLYLTTATGDEPQGEWIAYRQLPNTVAKTKTYDKEVDRIAAAFKGRLGDLETAASSLGGVTVDDESADLAIRFDALPRVPMLLLFWDGDEDFDARSSLLLDSGVLSYLDQESLVFLAQTLICRLLDEDDPVG